MQLPERELLEKLVAAGERWKSRDYVHGEGLMGLIDEFDRLLQEASNFLRDNRAPSLNQLRLHDDGCMGMQEVSVTTFHRPRS